MLWRVIVTLWWIGVGVSFLVSMGISAFALLVPDLPVGERVGNVIGIWVRWFFSVVGGVVFLFVLGLILFALGFPVAGFSSSRR